VIRLAVVDDPRASTARIATGLGDTSDLVAVGRASGEPELWPLLHRARPDVVLIGCSVPGAEGLVLCRRIKRRPPPVPRVVICAAQSRVALAIPAFVVGADGLIYNNAPAHEMREAIRVHGGHALPQHDASLLPDASRRLDSANRPILPMMLDGARPREVADTLRISLTQLEDRIEQVLATLAVAAHDDRQSLA
jgi:DNA-binding NarL/FixJ family response regulator